MATAGIIVWNKLESRAFNNLYSILDTRSNINDPRDPKQLKKRRFIYDSDPFDKRFDFDLLPYIILSMPTLVYGEKVADGSKALVTWRHKIIARTAVYGVSNFSEETGRNDILEIGDQLNSLFNSASGQTQLRGYRMQNIRLTKDNSDRVVVDGKDIYESNYTIEYSTLMDVVA